MGLGLDGRHNDTLLSFRVAWLVHRLGNNSDAQWRVSGNCVHWFSRRDVVFAARREIFPFLVIFIGVENVLVLIKAVTSTSIYLDVNVRVAEGKRLGATARWYSYATLRGLGLSKEGFALTKNLLSELALFTVGYFTYQPVMQVRDDRTNGLNPR